MDSYILSRDGSGAGPGPGAGAIPKKFFNDPPIMCSCSPNWNSRSKNSAVQPGSESYSSGCWWWWTIPGLACGARTAGKRNPNGFPGIVLFAEFKDARADPEKLGVLHFWAETRACFGKSYRLLRYLTDLIFQKLSLLLTYHRQSEEQKWNVHCCWLLCWVPLLSEELVEICSSLYISATRRRTWTEIKPVV